VRRLRAEWDGPISIDTTKSGVAEAALEAGADIVNDVTGLRGDVRMADVCRASGAGVVVMHMQGEPRTMQRNPHYEDVVKEVREFFEERLAVLGAAGIEAGRICLDPGIGFGKTLEHNLALLRSLGELVRGDRPLLIGLSRKSFIGRLLAGGLRAPEASAAAADFSLRKWPTVALTAWARASGALIHRVHDVKENREALRMMEAILEDQDN
jgi:dihydropteroate synthase